MGYPLTKFHWKLREKEISFAKEKEVEKQKLLGDKQMQSFAIS